MATHHITDEELDSLLSDYMTKESIELIVNKVRSDNVEIVEPADATTIQLTILRRLWRWSEHTNEEIDSPTFEQWRHGGLLMFEKKIEAIQQELIPRLDADKFNAYLGRTVEECLRRD